MLECDGIMGTASLVSMQLFFPNTNVQSAWKRVECIVQKPCHITASMNYRGPQRVQTYCL